MILEPKADLPTMDERDAALVLAARRQAFLEAAASLESLTRQDIRLAAGEMTAQEMRTVLAVLGWRSRKLKALAEAGRGVPA